MSDKSPKLKQEKSSCGGIGDYKVTIFTNAVLLAIIGYLVQSQLNVVKVYTDCGDYFTNGFRVDGVYEITPIKSRLDYKFDVYCNMTKGGWTVIMKREARNKNSINFEQDLAAYKRGFGSLMSDHFLGLDYIHAMTTVKPRQLMSILNNTEYKLGSFKVLNEYYHYKLIVDEEIDKYIDGTSLLRLNNSYFSTIDVDFDLANNSSCSKGWKAGWWFTDCFDHSICMPCLIMHGDNGVKNLNKAFMLIK
jgi:ficolin